MKPDKFKHYPQKPNNKQTSNAFVVLQSTHNTASSFLNSFLESREKNRSKGTSTYKEQDLLRAMLVFSTSGLDAMVKQLIIDALPTIIAKDPGATKMFSSYIEKKIKEKDQLNAKFLASVLADSKPRDVLLNNLVSFLCSGSLQSKDQLLMAAAYFNIASRDLSKDLDLMESIFKTRNQISHEMDIDFNQPNRHRRQRSQKKMIAYTNEVFRVAEAFLKLVDQKL